MSARIVCYMAHVKWLVWVTTWWLCASKFRDAKRCLLGSKTAQPNLETEQNKNIQCKILICFHFRILWKSQVISTRMAKSIAFQNGVTCFETFGSFFPSGPPWLRDIQLRPESVPAVLSNFYIFYEYIILTFCEPMHVHVQLFKLSLLIAQHVNHLRRWLTRTIMIQELTNQFPDSWMDCIQTELFIPNFKY